jgi:hypothetical protein
MVDACSDYLWFFSFASKVNAAAAHQKFPCCGKHVCPFVCQFKEGFHFGVEV